MKKAMIVAVWVAMVMAARAAVPGQGTGFQYVESRIFDGVRYDGATRTMFLLFDSGSAYAFHDVPRAVYLDFLRIVNKGEYFNREIRKSYRWERVDTYPASWCARD